MEVDEINYLLISLTLAFFCFGIKAKYKVSEAKSTPSHFLWAFAGMTFVILVLTVLRPMGANFYWTCPIPAFLSIFWYPICEKKGKILLALVYALSVFVVIGFYASGASHPSWLKKHKNKKSSYNFSAASLASAEVKTGNI